MVAWSALAFRSAFSPQSRNILSLPKLCPSKYTADINKIQVRTSKGRGQFQFVPTSFHWNFIKDSWHFYLLLGLIPSLCIIFYVNVFIGPGTLTPIPEGYEPKFHEYYQHPITRFISQYILVSPQEMYEKRLCADFLANERRLVMEIEDKVRRLMADRRDYQAWYYTPVVTRYVKRDAKRMEDQQAIEGFNPNFPFHK